MTFAGPSLMLRATKKGGPSQDHRLTLRASAQGFGSGRRLRASAQGDMVGGHPERSEGSQGPFGLSASG